MQKVLEIHKLKLPKEINDIIAKMAVVLLECEKCGKILRRTHKDRCVSWYTDGNGFFCSKCQKSKFSLQEMYKKRKK